MVELEFGQVLCMARERSAYAYFPTEGVISLLTHTDRHAGIEVGMIGREGMLGIHLALGIKVAPLQAVVQAAGRALRIESTSFETILNSTPALQNAMRRFTFVLMTQLAFSAGCVRYHEITPRLARRILMSQDWANSDEVHLTHEMLAPLLGVRRESITAAAGALQREGLIRYHRGELTVVNRSGLEQASCSCYALEKSVYAEHFLRSR